MPFGFSTPCPTLASTDAHPHARNATAGCDFAAVCNTVARVGRIASSIADAVGRRLEQNQCGERSGGGGVWDTRHEDREEARAAAEACEKHRARVLGEDWRQWARYAVQGVVR